MDDLLQFWLSKLFLGQTPNNAQSIAAMVIP
jgi:hypothetical protein